MSPCFYLLLYYYAATWDLAHILSTQYYKVSQKSIENNLDYWIFFFLLFFLHFFSFFLCYFFFSPFQFLFLFLNFSIIVSFFSPSFHFSICFIGVHIETWKRAFIYLFICLFFWLTQFYTYAARWGLYSHDLFIWNLLNTPHSRCIMIASCIIASMCVCVSVSVPFWSAVSQ